MRLSKQQLADNETKIRTAMSRLLNGDIPPGGGLPEVGEIGFHERGVAVGHRTDAGRVGQPPRPPQSPQPMRR